MEYYEALGIKKEAANASNIKKAYRKAAMKYHPDKNPGNKEAEDKFKLVNEAYSILSDPEKKSLYDQYGKDGLSARGQSNHTNPRDIFNDFFAGFGGFGDFSHRQNQRSRKGTDILFRSNIPLKDLIFGTKFETSIAIRRECSPCKGTGSDGPPSTCPECNGHGQVSFMRGFMNLTTTCSQCHGRGKIIKNHCKTCKGSGHTRENKNIIIDIPKGIRPGQTLRVQGAGNIDAGVEPGDLLFEIHCDEDFEIRGCDIVTRTEVDCLDACIGSEKTIKTFDGNKTVVIPRGIQHNNKIKLKGLGFPTDINSPQRGDLLLSVAIVVPKNLSKNQIETLHKVRES
jgi:molecular chaperone DnaJ